MPRLSDLAELNPGLPADLDPNETVSFLPMSAVKPDFGGTDRGEDRPYSEVKKGYTPFLHGDVLVAKITPCFENGKIAQADIGQRRGFGSTEFHVIRPRPSTSGRYLLHFLRQSHIRRAGEQRMTGSAGQRRVPESYLASLKVPWQPYDDQVRTAAVLDKVDQLRIGRKRTLALHDELGASIFLETFGDPVRNPRAWPRKRLADVASVITGNTPSRAVAAHYGTAIEWIKSDNISGPWYYATRAAEGLSDSGRKMARVVPAGSILVTCIAGSRSSIGNAAMVDREVAFNQQLNALVPRDVDPHFLYAQVVSGKALFQRAATDGMKGIVSKSRFQNIEVMVPPSRLQREFARHIQVVEEERESLRRGLAALDELLASLLSALFEDDL